VDILHRFVKKILLDEHVEVIDMEVAAILPGQP